MLERSCATVKVKLWHSCIHIVDWQIRLPMQYFSRVDQISFVTQQNYCPHYSFGKPICWSCKLIVSRSPGNYFWVCIQGVHLYETLLVQRTLGSSVRSSEIGFVTCLQCTCVQLHIQTDSQNSFHENAARFQLSLDWFQLGLVAWQIFFPGCSQQWICTQISTGWWSPWCDLGCNFIFEVWLGMVKPNEDVFGLLTSPACKMLQMYDLTSDSLTGSRVGKSSWQRWYIQILYKVTKDAHHSPSVEIIVGISVVCIAQVMGDLPVSFWFPQLLHFIFQ